MADHRASVEEAVRHLYAESKIRAALARYCRGVNRLDFELVASVFHSDARNEHGAFAGSVEEFVGWLKDSALARFTWTMHNLGTCGIDIVGDEAYVETYAVAYHGEPAGAGRETQRSSGVRYIDRFERRTGDDWLIARRLVIVEWRRELGIEALRPAGPNAPAGRHDRLDLSYQRDQ
jgi:SnoaL-like domain